MEMKIMKGKAKSREIDMLNGSIWDKLPRYALPIAFTGMLEQLFNASDIAIVGNFASTNRTVAIAAVGANSPIVGMILNLCIGIALGANVMIANAIGRKDHKTVTETVHTAVLMALIGGLIVTILGEWCIGSVLNLLNVPADVYPYAMLYIRIYLLGMPVVFLYNFEAAIFRSIGETKVPLEALAFSGVLNVILNLFFVIILKMSVNGVAIATVISNAVSSGILLIRLMRMDSWIHLDIRELKLHGNCVKRIIRIGLPAGVQGAVFNLANIVIQSAINSLGTVVIAASSAAFNIEIMVYYVINSYGQACTTFVGQNFGAGQLKRCRRVLVLCLVEDIIICVCMICIGLVFGKNLLAIFNSDPKVIAIGYIRVVMVFMADTFNMLYEIMSGYLRGFGISFVPAILTILGVCVVRILWVYTIFPLNRTFRTLMTVYPVSLASAAILIGGALLYYRPARRRQVTK